MHRSTQVRASSPALLPLFSLLCHNMLYLFEMAGKQSAAMGGIGKANHEMDAVRRRVRAAKVQVQLSQSLLQSSSAAIKSIEMSLDEAKKHHEVATIQVKASQLELQHALACLKTSEAKSTASMNKEASKSLIGKVSRKRKSVAFARLSTSQDLDKIRDSIDGMNDGVHAVTGDSNPAKPASSPEANTRRVLIRCDRFPREISVQGAGVATVNGVYERFDEPSNDTSVLVEFRHDRALFKLFGMDSGNWYIIGKRILYETTQLGDLPRDGWKVRDRDLNVSPAPTVSW